MNNALLKITNRQQNRIESPEFHTDYAFDWKEGKESGLWYFEWMFVDHGEKIEFSVVTRCVMASNEVASAKFRKLSATERQEYIHDALSLLVSEINKEKLKIVLEDAFEKFENRVIEGRNGEGWYVEISSRRLGIDNGMNTLMHIDQMLERALEYSKSDAQQ